MEFMLALRALLAAPLLAGLLAAVLAALSVPSCGPRLADNGRAETDATIEAVVIGPGDRPLRTLANEGFVLIERRPLAAPGRYLARIQLPPSMTAATGLRRIRAVAGTRAIADLNHPYVRLADAPAGTSPLSALCPTNN